jgi:thiol-disulfide isomerase/thioredoxin
MKIYLICICFLISKANIVIAQEIKSNSEISLDSVKLSPCLNKIFPGFCYPNIKGIQTTNKDLVGKITLIDFWFTSCAPCIAEIESFKSIYETFKTQKKFQLISFAWETAENATLAAKTYSIPYSIIPINRDECSRLNCGNGFPVLMIINEEGKIIFSKLGGSIDEIEATQYGVNVLIPKLKKLLSKAK